MTSRKLESIYHIGLGCSGEVSPPNREKADGMMSEETPQQDEQTDKQYGIWFNNQVWELLAKKERTPEDDESMIHAAHASHLHWLSAGTALHRQRGLWMLSHVYAELGLAERATHYAKESAAVAHEYKKVMRDFDHCYASEALARAYAISGDHEKANQHYFDAYADGKNIADDKDKEIFLGDLQSGNWGDFEHEDQS